MHRHMLTLVGEVPVSLQSNGNLRRRYSRVPLHVLMQDLQDISKLVGT